MTDHFEQRPPRMRLRLEKSRKRMDDKNDEGPCAPPEGTCSGKATGYPMNDPLSLYLPGYRLTRIASGDTALVDMLVPHKTENRSILLTYPWWRGDFQQGNGLFIVMDRVEVHDGKPRFPDGSAYQLDELEPWEDDYAIYTEQRKIADYDKGARIAAMQQLARLERDFRFAPALDALCKRPWLDLNKLQQEEDTKLREVGYVALYDAEGEKLDVLVVDDRGEAAVLNPDLHLISYANQWEGSHARGVTVSQFIHWVSERSVHGPYGIANPRVEQRRGYLEDIAREELCRRPE